MVTTDNYHYFRIRHNFDIHAKKIETHIVDIQINNQFDTCTNKLKLVCKATDRARPNDEQEATNQSNQLLVFRA